VPNVERIYQLQFSHETSGRDVGVPAYEQDVPQNPNLAFQSQFLDFANQQDSGGGQNEQLPHKRGRPLPGTPGTLSQPIAHITQYTNEIKRLRESGASEKEIETKIYKDALQSLAQATQNISQGGPVSYPRLVGQAKQRIAQERSNKKKP